MLNTRVIPSLLLRDNALIKTVKFKAPGYIGDPINTVRIFNELEVDEIMLLDIYSSVNGSPINFELIQEIADECFMPLAYGGGIKTFEDAKRIFNIGLEKVVINSSTFESPKLIQEISKYYGNQAVIGSVDVKKNLFGKYEIYSLNGTKKHKIPLENWVIKLEELGVGEILINSINRDGTWQGFDVDLVKKITEISSVPVIALGGARDISSISEVVHKGGANAVGVGSMVVYQGKDLGVLVNFPEREELESSLGNE